MFTEKLSEYYTLLEDKYFNTLDFLDEKGVPVYTYSDFFEEKGIPSFVVTIAIVILLIAMLAITVTGGLAGADSINLSLKDEQGNPLNNVMVEVKNANTGETTVTASLKNDGETIDLPPLPPGTRLQLVASKADYGTDDYEIILGTETSRASLALARSVDGIKAKVELIDGETGTKVNNAIVFVIWNEKQFQMEQDLNGTYMQTNIPEGTTLTVLVSAEGYNELEEQIIFYEGSVRSLSLTPSGQGFVGNASVVIMVNGTDANAAIEEALVKVYNKENEVVLLEDLTIQGSVSGLIQTGIPLRIIVEKDGYLTYDSEVEGESLTIREAEKQIVVDLKQGGEKLIVNSLNTLGLAIDDVQIILYRLSGDKFDEAYTTLQGAEFTGIDPSEEIIITAWKEGYIPQRKIVDISATESVDFLIENTASGNSVRLDIYSTDTKGNAVNNAKIRLFDYDDDGNRLPTGIEIETNIGGFVPVMVPTEKTYLVEAETEIMQGSASVVAIGSDAIDVLIRMSKKQKVVELVMTDVRGRQIYGTAIVDGLDGWNLYDGNITDSRVFFNAEDRETIELTVMMEDGNLFTENVYVKNKDYVEVVVYNRESDELAPSIEFIGLENEQGEEVRGITPGAFYWAKFSVAFPVQAERGGVHFRVGNDSIEFVDSDVVALYELSLQGAQTFQSYSYTPNPTPGNEVIDRANESLEGEESKWVEGLLTAPNGTYTAKVKIRVADFTAGSIPIHYRAWANIQEDYYRAPSDADLGRGAYSDNKSGLYAESLMEQLKLYESLPECSDNLCLTTNIIDFEDNFHDIEGFEALTGNPYALEVELSAMEADFAQISVTANDSIKFISTQVGETTNFVAEGSESATAGTSISLNDDGKEKVRFFFIAKEAGTATVDLTVTGESYIEKNLVFKVIDERKLLVELSSDNVILGRNFTVKVNDTGLAGVENALIKIIDKEGKVVKSISGDGGEGRGKNGNYRVENNLGTGLYSVEVTAPKSVTEVVPLLVTTQNVLTFAKSIKVKMAYNELSTIATEKLSNNSEFNLSNLSFEVEESENFKISANIPPALGANQSTNIPVTIEYTGGIDDSADDTITLKVSGFVEGKFFTTISTQVNVIYNRKLDTSCLRMEPDSLTIALVGSTGSTDSDTIEVTNNCEQVVFLKHRVKEKTKRSYIIVTSQDISLQPGETQNITVTANNLIDRQFSRDQTFSYEVVFDANYLKKTLPVRIRTVNPVFALSYPSQITMFLAQNSSSGKATAAQPIFVTNISDFTVEGIGFSIDKQYGSTAGITLRVEPPGDVSLQKGQSIAPPKYLFAQGSSTNTEPVRAKVLIKGRMANLNNSSGQRDNYGYYEDYYSGNQSVSNYRPKSKAYATGTQTLGEIDVTIYYSGFDCLTISPTDDLLYNLPTSGSPISKKISITNKCAEPVRITGATSRTRDIFVGLIPAPILNPNQGAEVRLSVTALKDNLRLTGHPIEITAIADLSQTPLRTKALPIDVYVGTDFASQYSKVRKGVSVDVCGPDGKILAEKGKADLPKLASGTDCAEGYCDAQNASAYVGKKLERIIKRAESQGYSKQNLAENFEACAGKGYCTFSEIGVSEDPFDLYLMNDRLSTETIKAQITDTSGTTTSGFKGGTLSTGAYLIEPFDVTTETIASVALSGYNRRIFLDNDFSGCGYYRVKIDGAFSVFGGQIQFDRPVIVIRAVDFEDSARIETAECATNIVNIQNHAPIDKDYSIGNDKGSWLTSVEAPASLATIGKDLAKSYFKSEDRFTSQGPGNTVRFEMAAVGDALAEVCVHGEERKTIVVKVDSGLMASEGDAKANFEKQISKMVLEALAGNFGEGNCLTQGTDGYDCLKLKNLSGLGNLKMKVPNKVMELDGKSGCLPAKIVSGVSEEVEFEVSKGEKFIGITRIVVKDPNLTGGKTYFEVENKGSGIPLKVIKTSPVKLMRGDKKDEPYSKDVIVCAYSDSDKTSTGKVAYLKAHESSFTLVALNKNAGVRATTDEDGLITINVGTLHPNDLIQRLKPPANMQKGKSSPYYFTIMWAGEPNHIIYDEYLEGLKSFGKVDGMIINTEDSGTKGTKKDSTITSSGQSKALLSYFTACGITSGICNAGTGIIGAALNVVADCGIPAATAYRADMMETFPTLRGAYGWLDNLVPFLGIDVSPDYQPANWKPITYGAASGAAKRIASITTPRIWGGVNTGNIKWFTKEVTESYTTAAKNQLEKAFSADFPNRATKIDELSKLYGKKAGDLAKKSFEKSYDTMFDRKGTIYRGFKNDPIKFSDAAQTAKLKVDGKLGNFWTENINKISDSKTADDLVTKLSGMSDEVTDSLRYANRIDKSTLQSKIREKLKNSGKFDGDSVATGKTITQSDVDDAVKKAVNDIYRDQPPQIRGQILDDLTIPTPDGGYSGSISELTHEGIVTRPAQAGTSIDDIVKNASDVTFDVIDDKVPKIGKLEPSKINKIGQEINEAITKELDDATKLSKVMKNKSKLGKLKNMLKSSQFWKEIGKGIACGLLSNAAGVYAYNRSMDITEKIKAEESVDIADDDFVFIKGETYKMIIDDTTSGEQVKPHFSHVKSDKDKADMLEYLGEKDKSNRRLVSKEDSDGRAPGERKLQLYLLKVKPNNAETYMRKIYSKNKRDSINSKLIKIETQLLVQRYTSKIVYSETNEKIDNPHYMVYKSTDAREDLVIPIILQLWNDPTFDADEDLVKEVANPKAPGKIKAKVQQAIKLIENSADKTMTAAIGEELFPGKGKEFEKSVGLWHAIYEKSTS